MFLKYIFFLLLVACAPTATGPTEAHTSNSVTVHPINASNNNIVTDTFNRINAARANAVRCADGSGGTRLPALLWESQLAPVALGHARNMDARKIISHTLDGLGPRDRVTRAGYNFLRLSEIIYQGSHANSAEAVRWWLNSPVHCHAIMNPYYKRMGVGVSGGSFVALLVQPK